MQSEREAALAQILKRQEDLFLSVRPALEEELEDLYAWRTEWDAKRLAAVLYGDSTHMSLYEFPEHQGNVLRDVLWAAERLLTDAECRTILKQRGLLDPFSREEEDRLVRFVTETLATERQWGELDLEFSGRGNAWAAITVARRVLAGMYVDVYSEAAMEYLAWNAHYNTRHVQRKKLHLPFAVYPLHVDEIMFIMKSLFVDPECLQLMKEYVRNGFVPRNYQRLKSIILHRYLKPLGFVSKAYRGLDMFPFMALRWIVQGEVNIMDQDSLKKKLEDYAHEDLFHFVTPEYSKYYRSRRWGAVHVLCLADGHDPA